MPDARELSDKALGLAESGHYEEALDPISKGINIDANNASATRKAVIWIANESHPIHSGCSYSGVRHW